MAEPTDDQLLLLHGCAVVLGALEAYRKDKITEINSLAPGLARASDEVEEARTKRDALIVFLDAAGVPRKVIAEVAGLGLGSTVKRIVDRHAD